MLVVKIATQQIQICQAVVVIIITISNSTTEPIKNAYKEFLRRGITTRFITEITE